MDRCSHGSDPPARPEEQQCARTVGQLPGHDIVSSDPRRPHPSRQVADDLLHVVAAKAQVAVDHCEMGTFWRQLPERPDVPWPTRLTPLPAEIRAPVSTSLTAPGAASASSSVTAVSEPVYLVRPSRGRTYRRAIANLTKVSDSNVRDGSGAASSGAASSGAASSGGAGSGAASSGAASSGAASSGAASSGADSSSAGQTVGSPAFGRGGPARRLRTCARSSAAPRSERRGAAEAKTRGTPTSARGPPSSSATR